MPDEASYPSDAPLAELRAVAARPAQEAARLVHERRLAGASLAERRPDDGCRGEEGTRSASASGVTWVVDPSDGTVNYLYGIPQYAVSVAVVDEEQRSLAGAVVDVARGVTYS